MLLGDPYTDPVSGNSALTRLNNQYSNANNRGSDGASHYEGFNAQFESSNLYHSGFGITANYTYAHQLDDLSTTFSESNNAFSLGYTNPYNPSAGLGQRRPGCSASAGFGAGIHGAVFQEPKQSAG